jgi:putative tricarboxylic transport membrane protein
VAERVLNVVWIVLGLAIVAVAPRYTIMTAQGPAGGLVPLLAGLMIACCGLLLLLCPGERLQVEWPSRTGWMRIAAIVGGLVAITLLMPRLGFVLTVFPIVAVLIQVVERKNWWSALLISAIATLAIYFLFTRLLASTLPRGLLDF